jgi:hypothetical protein
MAWEHFLSPNGVDGEAEPTRGDAARQWGHGRHLDALFHELTGDTRVTSQRELYKGYIIDDCGTRSPDYDAPHPTVELEPPVRNYTVLGYPPRLTMILRHLVHARECPHLRTEDLGCGIAQVRVGGLLLPLCLLSETTVTTRPSTLMAIEAWGNENGHMGEDDG